MSAVDAAPLTHLPRRAPLHARVVRRPATLLGFAFVIAFFAVAVFAPAIAPESPTAVDFAATFLHPSWHHLLGTDQLGRDEFSRVVYGTRVAMGVAIASTLIAFLIGVPFGLAAGYSGGWIDGVVARTTDVMLAFPFVILAISLGVILGPSLWTATLALAFAGAPAIIRVVRGETLLLREEGFVAAAIGAGASDRRVLFRHILPNITNTLLVQGSVFASRAVVGEAALAFLGLSVRPPGASWGSMLRDAETYLYEAPRLAVYPGIAIVLATAAFTVLGDGLRELLDPQLVR